MEAHPPLSSFQEEYAAQAISVLKQETGEGKFGLNVEYKVSEESSPRKGSLKAVCELSKERGLFLGGEH
jgi:hypothetical protein